MSYKSKLLINFTALFAVFTLLVVAFQYNRERQYRRLLLEERLRCYANLVAARQGQPADSLSHSLPALDRLLPPEVRLTIVGRDGTVRHETSGHTLESMGNHLGRPEVQQALMKGEGSDTRESTTEHRPYFYFAKAFGNEVVRVALPYDDTVRSFMQADRVFLWFIIMLFPVMLVLLIYISDRFGKAVTGLKSFMRSADRGLVDYDHIDFPHSELGDIGRGIMTKYRELEASNRLINTERERLLRHFHNFGQGIAIFSPERECIYANPRFMQYANVVLDRPTANPNALWQSESLAPAVEFLQLNSGTRKPSEQAPLFRYSLAAGGTTFGVQVLIYADGGFELTLTDITAEQQQRELKQQMSNNITHELRTPVSSIRGFVETLLQCDTLSEERRHYFLQRTYAQVVRLSDLIRDVALISKTEEAADTLPREDITLLPLVKDVVEELRPSLEAAGMQATIDIPERTTMHGNFSLLYGIFRNLMENSIRYAGHGTTLTLQCYRQEAGTLYFRYFDTGCGVAEEHLPRLFERFYRVSEGRTRDCGGTGLGLSIVRNAVHFHGGTISVRNRKGGGLEFLFTMKK